VEDTGVAPVITGQKLFLDSAGGDPADEVEGSSGLVVGSRHPRSSEGLLAHHSSCALVVDVCMSQRIESGK
jgi:hypothetical protein